MLGRRARAAGCNVSNCQVALNVLEAAEVDLRHSSLSFNEVALVGGGRGTIQNCQFWGNLHRSTIHLSEGALAATQARAPRLGRRGCAACPMLLCWGAQSSMNAWKGLLPVVVSLMKHIARM